MLKIMIVDDCKIIRLMLKDLFTRCGCEVVCEASNGIEAINKYRKDKFDLVTLDLNMPKMNGLSTLKAIKSYDPKSNIAICSTNKDTTKVEKSISLGAEAYLIKPITYEKLQRFINDTKNKLEVKSN